MNKILRNIAICGVVASAGVLASCEDYLTITPTSQIVEEDFWQDRSDLENAVYGCYKRMVQNDMLERYIYWGEERADNLERSTQVSTTGEVANIMNANLLPTYGQFNWQPAYNAINYCNKVLAHGPEIVASDDSFSEAKWKPIRAEVITLRAMCHFLLVRTFGEIPYVTTDYNNDSQELRQGQATQLEVLDAIIADLESIKDDAVSDYGNTVLNKGRITKKAVYALLADVYLWRASYKQGNNQPFTKVGISSNYAGAKSESELKNRHETYSTTAESDYQKCVEYCDAVIAMRTQEYIKYINDNGLNVGGAEIKVELEDLLEQNYSTSSSSSLAIIRSAGAYRSLFAQGNSAESIFELQVDGTTYQNSMVSGLFYTTKGETGTFSGVPAMFETVESNPNSTAPATIFTKTDMRRWETVYFKQAGQTNYPICKYMALSVEQSSTTTSPMLTDNNASSLKVTYNTRTSNSSLSANWIVYRMSEIYLMKAEAMTQLSGDEENLKEAFKYVREVFKRSNPYAYAANNNTASNDTLKWKGNFETQENMERLIMAERQREFIIEGKRWFDLVRFALRRGSTSEMLEILTRKYSSNRLSIQAKLADMQSLYSPVQYNEIKNNNLLYQNGVWSLNETSSKTDDL